MMFTVLDYTQVFEIFRFFTQVFFLENKTQLTGFLIIILNFCLVFWGNVWCNFHFHAIFILT